MLDSLREDVFVANKELLRRGLVVFTFGNASGYDRTKGLVVIKPRGVAYNTLRPKDLVITDIDGNVVEGELRPSSDLPTHLAIYRAFSGVNGVVHTHSRYATAWAQAGSAIPCLGTSHADYFRGPIPITHDMQEHEISDKYEWNTGHKIVECFEHMDPLLTPAILVKGHGPFCWGLSPGSAVHTAAIVEELAQLAFLTLTIRTDVGEISTVLRDKHFLRKYGDGPCCGEPITSNAE